MAQKETKTGRDEINQRLHDALEGLRKDVTRVEVWATALGSFSEPVPEYRPSKEFELSQAGQGETDVEDAAVPLVPAAPEKR